jgi:hypothetical protein
LLHIRERNLVSELTHRYEEPVASRSKNPLSALERQQAFRLRKLVQKTLDDLVWLLQNMPPDQQNTLFTEENIKKFVSVLLTSRFPKEKQDDQHEREERQYRIAAMLMEKGVAKCLKRVDEIYRERIERDALELMLILKKSAVGRNEAVNLSL